MGFLQLRGKEGEDMIKGQLTIFDTYTDNKPCRYKFKRYIGQKVRVTIGPWRDQNFKIGTITKIEPYYTRVRCGRKEYSATPYSLTEVKDDKGKNKDDDREAGEHLRQEL